MLFASARRLTRFATILRTPTAPFCVRGTPNCSLRRCESELEAKYGCCCTVQCAPHIQPRPSDVVFRYAATRAAMEHALSERMVGGRAQEDSGDDGTRPLLQLQQTLQQHASDDEKDKVVISWCFSAARLLHAGCFASCEATRKSRGQLSCGEAAAAHGIANET